MHQLVLPPLAEGETYIGAIGDKNGDVYHLILLSAYNAPADHATQIEWAKSVGGDLPTKLEGAMLFANARNQFEREAYWTNETFVDLDDPEDTAYAWYQYFDNGTQDYYHKSHRLRARAVRRLPI